MSKVDQYVIVDKYITTIVYQILVALVILGHICDFNVMTFEIIVGVATVLRLNVFIHRAIQKTPRWKFESFFRNILLLPNMEGRDYYTRTVSEDIEHTEFVTERVYYRSLFD